MKIIGTDKNGDEIAEVSVIELDTMFREIRNKTIDEFTEALRLECIKDTYNDLFLSEIFKIAKQLKTGGK